MFVGVRCEACPFFVAAEVGRCRSRRRYAAPAPARVLIGISLFEIGISLLQNRDFPLQISVFLRNFAVGNEDKGYAEVRPPT